MNLLNVRRDRFMKNKKIILTLIFTCLAIPLNVANAMNNNYNNQNMNNNNNYYNINNNRNNYQAQNYNNANGLYNNQNMNNNNNYFNINNNRNNYQAQNYNNANGFYNNQNMNNNNNYYNINNNRNNYQAQNYNNANGFYNNQNMNNNNNYFNINNNRNNYQAQNYNNAYGFYNNQNMNNTYQDKDVNKIIKEAETNVKVNNFNMKQVIPTKEKNNLNGKIIPKLGEILDGNRKELNESLQKLIIFKDYANYEIMSEIMILQKSILLNRMCCVYLSYKAFKEMETKMLEDEKPVVSRILEEIPEYRLYGDFYDILKCNLAKVLKPQLQQGFELSNNFEYQELNKQVEKMRNILKKIKNDMYVKMIDFYKKYKRKVETQKLQNNLNKNNNNMENNNN